MKVQASTLPAAALKPTRVTSLDTHAGQVKGQPPSHILHVTTNSP
jgi:hypothetical protein